MSKLDIKTNIRIPLNKYTSKYIQASSHQVSLRLHPTANTETRLLIFNVNNHWFPQNQQRCSKHEI